MPAATLRQCRAELVQASVLVSFVIGVLSLDIRILDHSSTSSEDVLQSLVDDLPDILASGWVGGGWSLSPDASISVAAAAELSNNYSADLLGLHGEMSTSDLTNPEVTGDLLRRVEEQHQQLGEVRRDLEDRVRKIQTIIRGQYAAGTASIDDWLT